MFQGSDTLRDNMQKVLVDLIELHLQGKQAHWNLLGSNFRDLHLQLDEIVDAAREFSDEVAERMRAVYLIPDGRSAIVTKNTSLEEFPAGPVETTAVVDLIVDRMYAVTETMRTVHDDVDDEDPTTADVLHGILERLEQLAWMTGAENRHPEKDARSPKTRDRDESAAAEGLDRVGAIAN
ncbi:DNA starvation/stationary phase protection protein [Frigoribacterium sp. CFBP9039]|uniref:Dps family protein n=1 Tax=Frigoribacterium TaxID=96492 RepID=UPI00177FDB46|nr:MULTISPECIES: DNA starvation/stationary phase protection protein [Frigoribacterium]MBD8703244.1 DNA starvation/stationary phase protection protein [Frigoribacterium sp. CFBP 13712]MCJ0701796.1 DNA starvation/stationary phase protection protein [Frigoribacterium faeni]MDY0890681.1 DNA starvation/stationary phase protection protein [Frigoribacterium sp. CFBP9030]MDY0946464.1 DNA starvation/stationary phase protection protein [Frigoribacterium sp. CFBP9039]